MPIPKSVDPHPTTVAKSFTKLRRLGGMQTGRMKCVNCAFFFIFRTAISFRCVYLINSFDQLIYIIYVIYNFKKIDIPIVLRMYPEVFNVIIFAGGGSIICEIVSTKSNKHFARCHSETKEKNAVDLNDFDQYKERGQSLPFQAMSCSEHVLICDQSTAAIVRTVFAYKCGHPNPSIWISVFTADYTSVVRQSTHFGRFVERSLWYWGRWRTDH